MKTATHPYAGYRFPSEIISHAVWLYHRFTLSFRDVEDLLAERGITVTYETIRQWCLTFGPGFARGLRHRRGRPGYTWYLDEVFVKIGGKLRYLWRAVDQDGEVLDILVQEHRNSRAAKRFFRKLLKDLHYAPRVLVTDKLGSYRVAQKALLPDTHHRTERWGNNRAEVSHQPTRQRERQMRRFKSSGQAQRFLSVHSSINNLFRVGRHLLGAAHHRAFRARAFYVWNEVTCA
jgi:putative transposase